MDINKEYSCLEQNCIVYKKCIENDEDYQEALPGYCDDVFRVVKCNSKSYITSINVEYGELKIFGRTEICLTYLNENSSLCYADFEEEFSKSVEIENLTDKAFAQAVVSTKYTSYKVINQRKISLHNTISIKTAVYDKVSCPCIKSCERSKLKIDEIKCASVIDSNTSKIDIDEEIALPADSCDIKRIVSSSSYAALDEIKIIKDKALIKGTVYTKLLYIQDDESEKICKYEYSFALSRIIDCQGITENDIAVSQISIGNLYFKLKTNSSNKVSCVEIFGEASVSTVFIRESTHNVVVDGYMLKNNSECSYSEINCRANGRCYSNKSTQKLSYKANSGLSEILEVELQPQPTEFKDGCLVCPISASILYRNAENEIMSTVDTKEFKIEFEGCDDAIGAFSVESYDYTISNDDCVEVRVCVNTTAYVFNNKTVKVLSEIYPTDDVFQSPALTIYFARANESVWSIAKAFASDTDLILKENNLTSDTIDCNRTIIIPGI